MTNNTKNSKKATPQPSRRQRNVSCFFTCSFTDWGGSLSYDGSNSGKAFSSVPVDFVRIVCAHQVQVFFASDSTLDFIRSCLLPSSGIYCSYHPASANPSGSPYITLSRKRIRIVFEK